MFSAKLHKWALAAVVMPWLQTSSAAGGEALLNATDWQVAHAARVRLVSGGFLNSADPASPRLAGVEIRLDPNWKTYWRMPGEAGVPPQFDWSKSENVARIDVLYPAPRRYPDKGGDAVGYSNEVIFPVAVTPRDASRPVRLRVEVSFGICREICVPLETTLGAEVSEPPAGTKPPAHIRAMLERVPRPAGALRSGDPRVRSVTGAVGSDPKALTVVAETTGDSRVEDLFVEGPDGFYVPMAKRASNGPGPTTFTIDFHRLSDASDLVGKPLRITVVGRDGASETTFTPSK